MEVTFWSYVEKICFLFIFFFQIGVEDVLALFGFAFERSVWPESLMDFGDSLFFWMPVAL